MLLLRITLIVVSLGLPLGLTSCATTGPEADRPARDESTSSIPWNRPAGWEGSAGIPGIGGMGGMRGDR